AMQGRAPQLMRRAGASQHGAHGRALLGLGVVPIVNENDTVATDEIRFGDNDRLAARVAQMVSADLLILLSDIDGLYTADPNTDDTAEFVAHLTEITPDIEAMAGGANAKSGTGTGGMATKISAAQIAYAAGCACAITLGARDRPLRDLEAGARATWIEPSVSAETARRLWLKGHLLPEGRLSIDEGAATALAGGASLLAVGIVSVAGSFERGAAVSIQTANGRAIGMGVTAYAAADIRRIAGRRTDEIEAILGLMHRPAVIHRNDLVLNT
ncbi:MAG: glutamate 5-kinase, partial [Pseudomonadota bacterium]